MKLIYIGNDYKYETEAIMKLFLPAEKFEFLYEPAADLIPDGDRAVLTEDCGGGAVGLRAEVWYGGSSSAKEDCLSFESGKNERESALCRLLYLAMNELTGKISEWGILTGVRPVKQVHRLAAAGLCREEIFDVLRGEYFVSENKSRIAWETAEAQRGLLEETARRGGRYFGLYVSIPFCPTRCSYCSFISQSAAGRSVIKLIPPYIENLCEELRCIGRIAGELGLTADSVYFGGGTPTTLTAAQLTRIMRTISENFDLSQIREYTIEAGRPDTVTEEKLRAIFENGCTRVSVNPQTLSDSVLQNIGRSHTAAEFFESFRLARQVGFDTINTDVIAGLPGDDVGSFRATIDGLIELSPENITVHTLSVKRSSRLNMNADKGGVFENPAQQMVEYANERLSAAGYRPYYLYRQKNMVDNLENIGWSKPGHESVYNVCIMEEVQTILAAGAVGSTKLIDAEGGRLERVFNYKYPIDYNKNFELMLKRKEKIREFFASGGKGV